jgi:hypothetical protein
MIQVDTFYELARQHRRELQAKAGHANLVASSQMCSDASSRPIGLVTVISRLASALAAPATRKTHRSLSHV